MIKLLEFVVTYLFRLFDEYGFLIKESGNSGNRFSGASILIVSSELEIFLAIERDEVTADFRSVFDSRKNNWYSVDVVLALLGYRGCRGVLDDKNSILLQKEIPQLIHRFHESEINNTLQELAFLEKERSDNM
jgi:hypothetical protein